MIVYFILILILVACLSVIAFIVVRKFPKLSALDLEAMKHHKQAQVKVSIVEERLERNLRTLKNKLTVSSAPLRKRLAMKIKGWYQKALHLQREYRQKALRGKPLKLEDKEAIRQKINTLIAEAQELIKREKMNEAEKKYIEAISLDKQNIESYRGLAELYIAKKDYAHAKETLEFIKQVNPNDDAIWMQLANLFELLNNPAEALKHYKKAVDLSPNNPKNLDALLVASIAAKDSYLAKITLQKLAEVNPDNSKLDNYKLKVKEL